MAEVGTRSSMTSNHEIMKVGSSTWPLNHCCSVYSCYRVGPAITFHAVYTACTSKEWASEASHTPCNIILTARKNKINLSMMKRSKLTFICGIV